MEIKLYKKKPVVIKAMQFKSDNDIGNKNMSDIVNWINQGRSEVGAWHNGTNIFINTLEGTMRADFGDFIIQGVKGEFYPCKPDIFKTTYEEVISE